MSHIEIQRVVGIVALTIMKGHCVPLKWHQKSHRLYLYRMREESDNFDGRVDWEKLRFSLFLGIHRVASLTLIGQVIFFQILKDSSCTLSTKIANWAVLILCFLYHTLFHFCATRSDDIATLLNELLASGESLSQYSFGSERSFTERINMSLVLLTPPSTLIVPIGLSFGLHWVNPHKPTLIGYWLLAESGTFLGFLTKLGVLLFNYWFWTSGILATIACIGFVQVLSVILLRDHLRAFGNLEASGEHPFGKRVNIYRQIQVLECLQNKVQAGTIMSITMVCLTTALPLSLVLILRQAWTSDNMFNIIMWGYLTCTCVASIIFIFGGHSGLWSDSRGLLVKLDHLNVSRRPTLSGKEWKLWQAFWRSCRNLVKVKFGVNNFVEEETPLNCLNFAVSIAVQLLLLGD